MGKSTNSEEIKQCTLKQPMGVKEEDTREIRKRVETDEDKISNIPNTQYTNTYGMQQKQCSRKFIAINTQIKKDLKLTT